MPHKIVGLKRYGEIEFHKHGVVQPVIGSSK